MPTASTPGTEIVNSLGRGQESSPAHGATARTCSRCSFFEKLGIGTGVVDMVRVALERSWRIDRMVLGTFAMRTVG